MFLESSLIRNTNPARRQLSTASYRRYSSCRETSFPSLGRQSKVIPHRYFSPASLALRYSAYSQLLLALTQFADLFSSSCDSHSKFAPKTWHPARQHAPSITTRHHGPKHATGYLTVTVGTSRLLNLDRRPAATRATRYHILPGNNCAQLCAATPLR